MESFKLLLSIFLALAQYCTSYNGLFEGNSYYFTSMQNYSVITAHNNQWDVTTEQDAAETIVQYHTVWKVLRHSKDPGYLELQNEVVLSNSLSGYPDNPRKILMKIGRNFPEVGETWQIQVWQDNITAPACVENKVAGDSIAFLECKYPLVDEALPQLWKLAETKASGANN